MTDETTPKTEEKPPEFEEIHQAWTLHLLQDHPDLETNYAFMGRPQDWGDSKWKYRHFVFELTLNLDRPIRYHSHIWTDSAIPDGAFIEYASGLITQIVLPSEPVELCADTHIATEDFWMSDWGEPPEIYETIDDDWTY